MAAGRPWFKFYPTDWRADQALRMCSPAARGMWIELMCIMHEATPYGHLVVNGMPVSDTQIATLTGISPDQVAELLAELESAGVFSRTRARVIYSRRMVRDEKKARLARKSGKSGGNPKLIKQRENQPSVKGTVKGDDNTQSPESRVQTDSSLRSESEEGAPNGAADKYAFRGKTVRLFWSHYREWEAAYQHIDLRALLQNRDDWYQTQPASVRKDWFMPTSNWLANKNEEAAGKKPKRNRRQATAIYDDLSRAGDDE